MADIIRSIHEQRMLCYVYDYMSFVISVVRDDATAVLRVCVRARMYEYIFLWAGGFMRACVNVCV